MEKPVTILYLDDEQLNLMLFNMNFRKEFQIITASNGEEGLAKLRLYSEIKVVISDLKMPGMNGIEFVRKAKQEFPDNAYFILTGYEITEELESAMNDKMILDTFQKPINISLVKDSIKKVTGQ
jgi:two-component system response regulator (stage 0 sporulation protein F)